jgi:hypothetical protein
MADGLRPLYCPWPRCFRCIRFLAFGAAFTLPCCALRRISGGATMAIEALVGFGSSTFSTGQGSSYVRYWVCSLVGKSAP